MATLSSRPVGIPIDLDTDLIRIPRTDYSAMISKLDRLQIERGRYRFWLVLFFLAFLVASAVAQTFSEEAKFAEHQLALANQEIRTLRPSR